MIKFTISVEEQYWKIPLFPCRALLHCVIPFLNWLNFFLNKDEREEGEDSHSRESQKV